MGFGVSSFKNCLAGFAIACVGVALQACEIPGMSAMKVSSSGVSLVANQARSFYVSNSGADSNSGLSASQAWQSVGKVNSVAASGGFRPGDSILFKRGDTFRDDYIRCTNHVTATDASSVSAAPLNCSGNSAHSITFGAYGDSGIANPIFDGANALNLIWTAVTSDTFSAPLPSGAAVPANLYIDSLGLQTTALLAMPNAKGTYSSSSAYQFLDLVVPSNPSTTDPQQYVCGNTSGCPAGTALSNQTYFANLSRSAAATSQTFSTTNSGTANVQATGGSWTITNGVIYVHLNDGSNPGDHTVEGAVRAHGVYLESVNYVTVKNLTVTRTVYNGIVGVTYSDSTLAGAYRTNEYITIDSNQLFNIGGSVLKNFPMQTSATNLETLAEITAIPLVKNSVSIPLLRGWVVTNNQIGNQDGYYGSPGATFAGISMMQMDSSTITVNFVSTTNGIGIIYGHPSNTDSNNGGEIANNELTNNSQGNLFFGETNGGRVHHNHIHDSLGEGIQLGGHGTGFVVDHNVIHSLGLSANAGLFNGIDCNGAGTVTGSILHNTIWNTYAANVTMENVGSASGCVGMTVENNIFSQGNVVAGQVNYSSSTQGSNAYVIYVSQNVRTTMSWHFDHNLWNPGTNPNPFYSAYNCSNFFTGFGDSNSSCASPLFNDAAHGDFTLKSGSTALGAATDGSNLGAL